MTMAADEIQDFFVAYRTEPEVTYTIDNGDDSSLTIEIAKLGGGTLGERYVGQWIYRVCFNGELLGSGVDFRTGTAMTHLAASWELACLLAVQPEFAEFAELLECWGSDN